MRILIVEDDKAVSEALKKGLEIENFAVDVSPDGEHGAYLASINEYDLLILDNNLPGKEGWQILSDLRREGKKTPVIVISVNKFHAKKVELLDLGADDYITKPFSYEELMARIRAILRRPHHIENEILEIDDLRVDIRKQKVCRGDECIYLTRKEFGMLEYLLRNRGYVVTRNALLDHVWDMSADIFSNTIESHILNLRRKLETRGKARLIYTVPGRGYKLDVKR